MIALTSKRSPGRVTSFDKATKAELVDPTHDVVSCPLIGLMNEKVCVADSKTSTKMQICVDIANTDKPCFPV